MKGSIAYFSNRNGSYELWLYDLSNGANVQWTKGLGDSFSIPYWSPDASKIAFVGRDAVLFVIDLETEEIARIDQFEDGFGHYIDWSTDNESIVYSKKDIIVIYHVTTHQTNIIEKSDTTDVQWFPSSNEILFQAPDATGVSQLYRLMLGETAQQITQNTGGRYNYVRLSPDGKFVLYTTPGASNRVGGSG